MRDPEIDQRHRDREKDVSEARRPEGSRPEARSLFHRAAHVSGPCASATRRRELAESSRLKNPWAKAGVTLIRGINLWMLLMREERDPRHHGKLNHKGGARQAAWSCTAELGPPTQEDRLHKGTGRFGAHVSLGRAGRQVGGRMRELGTRVEISPGPNANRRFSHPTGAPQPPERRVAQYLRGCGDKASPSTQRTCSGPE